MDLIPIELGSFDVIIGMILLTRYHAMIIRDKKIVRILIGDETLTIQSNRSDLYTSIIASEQRAELFNRIGTLERDNMRLGGTLGVESGELQYGSTKRRMDPSGCTSTTEN
ncbi:hypothetical protein Tco_1278847 [Tanacetum coccineum]